MIPTARVQPAAMHTNSEFFDLRLHIFKVEIVQIHEIIFYHPGDPRVFPLYELFF